MGLPAETPVVCGLPAEEPEVSIHAQQTCSLPTKEPEVSMHARQSCALPAEEPDISLHAQRTSCTENLVVVGANAGAAAGPEHIDNLDVDGSASKLKPAFM